MTIPIWFLDIDGVINSVGMPEAGDGVDPSLYSTIEVPTSEDVSWPITYSSKVVDFINEMSRSGLVEVHWLTTWQQDAHRFLGPAIGLDTFPAFDEPEMVDTGWWKESVAREALRNDPRPYIWTDDDLTIKIGDSMQRHFVQDSLLIGPSMRPGLTDKHLEAIRMFVSGRTQSSEDHKS